MKYEIPKLRGFNKVESYCTNGSIAATGAPKGFCYGGSSPASGATCSPTGNDVSSYEGCNYGDANNTICCDGTSPAASGAYCYAGNSAAGGTSDFCNQGGDD